MATKHLGQLLSEDQEPFVLKNYIYERRCQLKIPAPETHIQVKRRKPISENPIFLPNFCKNVCFFSFHHDSPNFKKSPLFDFSSPSKSPYRIRNSNTLIFHIPSRTATLLLEAALRIKHQSPSQKKPKIPKNFGFGFLGSFLKTITHRKWNRKREIKRDEIKVSVKDILRWDSSDGHNMLAEERTEDIEMRMDFEEKKISDVGFSCSCNSRLSSYWSESHEEKSLDSETSTCRSEGSEEIEFVVEERKNRDFNLHEKNFCSKSSPFRLLLQNNSSPCRQPPGFQSPVTSPSSHKIQEFNKEEGCLNCVAEEYKEEENEEQCSPISILDPQFKDNEEVAQEDDMEEENNDDDCSFTIVQKAKQQLLHKLCRFDRLAELDPIDLEKRIDEQEEDDLLVEEEYDDDDGDLSDNEQIDPFIGEVIGSSNLESWMDVELNTIAMMVELDFLREGDVWWKNPACAEEEAIEIELSIFNFLLEELSTELAYTSGICMIFRSSVHDTSVPYS